MAAETIRLGMCGRVTASHTTAMHSYNNAYAYRLINNLKRAQLHMVTNPLDNSILQGRFDGYPIRRGHTRVKELLRAGVNVCIGHDSVMDPWYPLGYGDPLQAAFVLAHYGQMSGHGELRTLMDMITWNPASALGGPGTGCCRAAGPTSSCSRRRRRWTRSASSRRASWCCGAGRWWRGPSRRSTTVMWDGARSWSTSCGPDPRPAPGPPRSRTRDGQRACLITGMASGLSGMCSASSTLPSPCSLKNNA